MHNSHNKDKQLIQKRYTHTNTKNAFQKHFCYKNHFLFSIYFLLLSHTEWKCHSQTRYMLFVYCLLIFDRLLRVCSSLFNVRLIIYHQQQNDTNLWEFSLFTMKIIEAFLFRKIHEQCDPNPERNLKKKSLLLQQQREKTTVVICQQALKFQWIYWS